MEVMVGWQDSRLLSSNEHNYTTVFIHFMHHTSNFCVDCAVLFHHGLSVEPVYIFVLPPGGCVESGNGHKKGLIPHSPGWLIEESFFFFFRLTLRYFHLNFHFQKERERRVHNNRPWYDEKQMIWRHNIWSETKNRVSFSSAWMKHGILLIHSSWRIRVFTRLVRNCYKQHCTDTVLFLANSTPYKWMESPRPEAEGTTTSNNPTTTFTSIIDYQDTQHSKDSIVSRRISHQLPASIIVSSFWLQ